MKVVYNVNDIDKVAWGSLIQESSTATWFQTHEAYEFFASLSFLEPFVVSVTDAQKIKGLVVGYIQKDGGKLKQYLSRRAIIIGGPLLADDITLEELSTLLTATKKHLQKKTIYIEARNLNDYGRLRNTFEDCGFNYEPHLNFHVHTESVETAQYNIGKHRWKYIRLSLRDGAKQVERPTLEQVKDFYLILQDLYRTKVKRPLYPFEFFEKLMNTSGARFFLLEYDGEIVGGSVCVCLNGRTVYEWAKCGNEHRHKNIRPSSVVTWLGIKYAAENGFPRYDFMGAGKPNESYGVRDFKAEFGGELVEHGRYILVCNKLLYSMGKLAIKLIVKK